MFLNAHTTAKTQNKHVRVLKSKYERYCESGGTIKDVIKAAIAAILITMLFLKNETTKSIPHFLKISPRHYSILSDSFQI